MEWMRRHLGRNMGLIALMLLVSLVLAAGCLAAGEKKADKANDGKVNINTATVEELMKGLLHWDGSGPLQEKDAKAIVEFRKKYPFRVPEDIFRVPTLDGTYYTINKDRIKVKD